MDVPAISNVYLWTVEELRNFLKKRNIPCSNAPKSMLQRQAHFAIHYNFEKRVDDTPIANSIQQKLILEDGLITLPDPNSIDTWEVQSNSIPPVTGHAVEKYFETVNKKYNVSPNECKALALGKGLVLSGHADVLLYNGISTSISYCFLKTFVVRQTNVREQPHTVWVVLQKDNGTVHRAYCTCPGGVGGSCKHVAALLYMATTFIETGNYVSCTSKAQQWGKPGRFHQPDFVKNVPLKKLKKNCEVEEINRQKRRRFSFDPRAPQDRNNDDDIENGPFDMAVLSKITNGKAAVLFSLNMTNPVNQDVSNDLNVVAEETVHGATIPATISEISNNLKNEGTDGYESFSRTLKNQMKITAEESETVEKVTRKQAECPLWKAHRVGRVTGSRVKDAISKVGVTLDVTGKTNTVMKSIMAYDKPFTSKSTEYGLTHEETACQKALKLLQPRHDNMTARKCGMYILYEHPCISSSPDRMLHCCCCGSMPLEVKNPYTHRQLSVLEYCKTYGSCLELGPEGVRLKKNHSYYYQVQCHLLVTKCKQGVFCLRTNHADGTFLETISYDSAVIQEIIVKSEIFFDKAVIPELYFEPLHKDMIAHDVISDVLERVFNVLDTPQPETCLEVTTENVVVVDFETAVHVDINDSDVTYICGICMSTCVSEPMMYSEKSIECSQCECWYHMHCVGLKGDELCVKSGSKKWLCFHCLCEE